jgi:hypothetical protein
MELDGCTYRVSGKAEARLALYCSKTIEDHMFYELVPAKLWGVSSTYCDVTEDDVEIIWENEKERLNHSYSLKYDWMDDEPETMTFRVFDIELSLSFTANGIEVDSETFLDNLYISVEFMESIYESMYSDKGFQISILEGTIQPFEYELTVL